MKAIYFENCHPALLGKALEVIRVYTDADMESQKMVHWGEFRLTNGCTTSGKLDGCMLFEDSLFRNIDRCVGLHEEVRYWYRVTEWEIQLLIMDGHALVMTVVAKSFAEALALFNHMLKDHNLDSVRDLPVLRWME